VPQVLPSTRNGNNKAREFPSLVEYFQNRLRRATDACLPPTDDDRSLQGLRIFCEPGNLFVPRHGLHLCGIAPIWLFVFAYDVDWLELESGQYIPERCGPGRRSQILDDNGFVAALAQDLKSLP
jgi:hypothetical protein